MTSAPVAHRAQGASGQHAAAEAQARAGAVRITLAAEANAESIRKVNEAIQAGGESYFRYRQIEMLPEIVPAIDIGGVIRSVLAAQLVARSGVLDN